jgi:ATPase subunit of ABC transporter with duplicated ATPase domains
MLQKPNVLVLDKPTNRLDLESINALNVTLQKHDGTT